MGGAILAAASGQDAFHLGLGLTAFGFGFRHGIDWDHIAALTDITGSQDNPRRSMYFATMYALGHALVVLVLGVAAVILSARLPASIEGPMQRLVGATLLVLGAYVFFTLVRQGRDFRMRSRWMLAFEGVRRVGNRVRQGRDRQVNIEHVHQHTHVDRRLAHTHLAETNAREGAGIVQSVHRHAHRHVDRAPDVPFMQYGMLSAFLVGMLHGIGAETPTQVLIFLAAAGVGGKAAGVILLGCFVVGLLASNTAVALAGTFGFLRASRHFGVYASVSVLTATFSLAIGSIFVLGRAPVLPAFFGG